MLKQKIFWHFWDVYLFGIFFTPIPSQTEKSKLFCRMARIRGNIFSRLKRQNHIHAWTAKVKYLYFSEVSFSAFPQDELGHGKVWVTLFDPDHHQDEGLAVPAGEEAGLDGVVESHLAVTAGADLTQLTLPVSRSSQNSNNVQGGSMGN